MPDLVTHVWFSEQAAAALPEEVSGKLRHRLYPYAAVGPDVWFPCGFYGGADKALAPRGGHMHENATGPFLLALAERCRASDTPDLLFAYLAGYLCHYCLDRTAHPYIIYRTGDYEMTPETLRYRGNHTRLERAIDVYLIRHAYHTTPRRFNLCRRCLPLRRLPEAIREDLDAVYRDIYGWEDTWTALNRAVRDHRLLYWLLRDSTGILNPLTKVTDNGRSYYDYRQFSYQGRDLEGSGIDFLNLAHREWRNFADPSQVSAESFPELAERAKKEVVELITIIYNYVYLRKSPPAPLEELLGNASYTSGLDCRDERNLGPKVYDPLF